jgi:flagellar hook-associated protein 2
MATSASSLTSGLSTFNGSSQYAGSLQNAINHAVLVASIPLTQVQNNLSDLQSQSSELSTLQSDFGNLQTAIQKLSDASGSNALTATVGDNTVVSASVNSSATANGTYVVKVISAGSPTTTISGEGLPLVADPAASSISTASSYTLSVDGSTYNVTPSSNTLNALAEAINSGNFGVSASVINIGPPNAPDYRISVQSTSLGNDQIQLSAGNQNLLTLLAPGMPAQYQVNGQPSTPISSNSSTVTIAPGVNVNLLQAGQTTITVAPDSTAAANALSALATAYNTALGELGKNHGNNGGPLTGQSITFELQQSLRNLVQYTGGSGSVQNLTALGLSFDSQGQMTFDATVFQNAQATSPSDVSNFLGSASSGGFLQTATNLLNGLQNVDTGLFAQTQNSFQQQITADNKEVTDTQARITTMYNSMVAQMSQADTLIATLQSQVTYYTQLFQATQNAIQFG